MIKKSLTLLFVLLMAVSAVSAGFFSEFFNIATNRITGAETAVMPLNLPQGELTVPGAILQCSDSDGFSVYLPGVTAAGVESYSDKCMKVVYNDKDYVMEYYCKEDRSLGGAQIECPKGSKCASNNGGPAFCQLACYDIDFKDPYSGSTAVGYKDTSYSEIISQGDSCLSKTSVSETYCKDDGTIGSSVINCPPNTRCNELTKRCESVSAVAGCTDTDGFDSSTKGIAKSGVVAMQDACMIPLQEPDGLNQAVAACKGGDDCYVKEAFCVAVKGGRMRLSSQLINCKYGCDGGKCLAQPAAIDEGHPLQEAATKFCEDSDGGKAFNVKGTVTSDAGTFTDSCFDSSTVLEYLCDGTSSKSDKEACPEGCSDGACMVKESTICEDSDGQNQYAKGIVKTDLGGEMIDTCIGEESVIEYFCDGNTASKRTLGCGVACKDGACIDTCIDSDGDDPTKAGFVKTPTYQYVDECTSSAAVTEFTCRDDKIEKETKLCGEGSRCKDGMCATEPGEVTSSSAECKDGDDGSIYTKGKATISNKDAEMGFSEDACLDSNTLIEYNCQKTTNMDGTPTESILASNIVCENGCDDGKCVLELSCEDLKQKVGELEQTIAGLQKKIGELESPASSASTDDTDTGAAATATEPAPEVCGDSICQSDETKLSCPEDCLGPGYGRILCGDGVCDSRLETMDNCREDCGPSQDSIRTKIKSWIQGLS